MAVPTLDYFPREGRWGAVQWRRVLRFLGLAGVLIAVELMCARLAYYTIGEVFSGILVAVVIILNMLAIGVGLASRRAGAVALVLVAMLIVLYQCVLGVRWWRVQREADRVLAWVQGQKAATGQYPANLNAYPPSDPGVMEFIGYSRDAGPGSGPFHLSYTIGTPTTSHWWEPGRGWFYYPD